MVIVFLHLKHGRAVPAIVLRNAVMGGVTQILGKKTPIARAIVCVGMGYVNPKFGKAEAAAQRIAFTAVTIFVISPAERPRRTAPRTVFVGMVFVISKKEKILPIVYRTATPVAIRGVV
jgi:hypothetical protein